MKNKLKYIYLSIVATLIFIFTFTLVNTKTYAYHLDDNNNIVSENLIIITTNNHTQRSILATKNSDGTISINGTASSTGYVEFIFNIEPIILNGNYYWTSFLNFNANFNLKNSNNTNIISNSFQVIGKTANLNDTATKVTIGFNATINVTYSYLVKPMLIEGTIAPTEYQEGGIWYNQNLYNDLQDSYDSLEDQYNDLQDDFNALENQYDTLSSNYATLQQNYNDLQSQYNTLNNTYSTYVNSHSYTNTEYQELQSQITTLQSQISTLQTQYQDLLLQYNNLQSDYNVLYNSSSIGWFSFVNRIGYFKTLNPITTDEKDLSYLVNNNYIIGDTFNIGQFVDENSTTGFNLTELSFERQKVLLEELSFTINDYDDFSILRIQIYNPYTDETTVEVQWNFQIYGNVINERSVYSAVNGYVVSDAEWEEYIEDNDVRNFNSLDRLIFVNFTGYDTTIITNSSVDGQSYIKGFSAGIASQNLNYNQVRQDYQRVLLEKNDILYEYNVLKQDYLNLSANYNSLQTSYNNSLEGNNFVSLFFTIAETPFASFKQIWNVDFLGVNLSGFVTGLLFIGLLIWLVKKIF